MNLRLTSKDHVLGSENARIVLVEYADYQCPYCKKAYYTIKEAQEKLGNNLKFVFRNFPLVELHANALKAAVAAEAAAKQNKFWEMHDIIFENQKFLSDNDLINYAEQIGLDMNKFEQDFGKSELLDKVQEDYDSGIMNGVEGTPTFFINGEMYNGNWMSSDFIDDLQSILDKQYI